MTREQARCTNVPICAKANNREVVLLSKGAPLDCPQCGAKLKVIGKQPPRWQQYRVGIVTFLLLVGSGAIGGFYRTSHRPTAKPVVTNPGNSTANTATRPTPPVVPPVGPVVPPVGPVRPPVGPVRPPVGPNPIVKRRRQQFARLTQEIARIDVTISRLEREIHLQSNAFRHALSAVKQQEINRKDLVLVGGDSGSIDRALQQAKRDQQSASARLATLQRECQQAKDTRARWVRQRAAFR